MFMEFSSLKCKVTESLAASGRAVSLTIQDLQPDSNIVRCAMY